MENEQLVYFGGEIKAMGDGKVGGYLVQFKSVDLEGDFFDSLTDYGIEDGARLPVYYQHGLDATIKNRKIGKGTIRIDDAGLWLEAQLEMRDEYERMIYGMAEAGKLGWSSGAAGHLVDRQQVGKSWRISSWPIAEASLTPTPAEPRNSAVPIKSLIEPVAVVTEQELEATPEPITTQKESTMDENEIKVLLEQVATKAAEDAVKKMQEAEPKIKGGFDVSVTGDEADRALKGNPFKVGEYFQAVKQAASQPYNIDKRLLPLKATGLNEAIPSEGGFLVAPEIAGGIQTNMWKVGSFLSTFNPIRVSGNALTINAIDETSRSDGSRMGGIRGYWLEEGGTKTASKPKFRQIDLKLKKLAALCYATDELLADAMALESWITNYVPDELRFMAEASLMSGDGVGKPLGILNGGALISAVRTDANEIDAYDVSRMWAHRYPGVNDYVWAVTPQAWPQLMSMSVGNMPVFMPPSGLTGGQYATLLGRQVIETEYNPSLGVAGDILLYSPSQVAVITKGGVEAASSIHVAFLTDESVFRFVYRIDAEPIWYTEVTSYYASTDVISPFVVLSATT